jgi:hypothetical protein
MQNQQDLKTASLEAELQDRSAENCELRRDIGRALQLLEKGDTSSATTLLRRLVRTT